MKTWIVDWGKDTSDASRYALVQSCEWKAEADVLLEVQELADHLNSNYDLEMSIENVRVLPLEIEEDPEGLRYMEIGKVEPWHGSSFANLFGD